ncbi:MAG: hypothetical protein JW941_04435, partial [Candidatus Coatesbacteria bacterium]|nr:hypothetical protein [Candidatus Coatesbacteria bacterium]
GGVVDCPSSVLGGACEITINTYESCPTRHPMYGIGSIKWYKGETPYFDHWGMINSCIRYQQVVPYMQLVP